MVGQVDGVRTALITPVHGRHGHLRAQQDAIARLDPAPDQYGSWSRWTTRTSPGSSGARGHGRPSCRVTRGDCRWPRRGTPARPRRWPAGAELLVFLDVDCLPAPRLLHHYAAAARSGAPALLCGPVAYLPPPPPGGYDPDRLSTHPFHAARPAPPPGVRFAGGDHRLFWSLSFAITAENWDRVGGFCPDYAGYGGEDTDFAMLARARRPGSDLGRRRRRVPPVASRLAPPVAHLDDILRNGALFAERWGWWPMERLARRARRPRPGPAHRRTAAGPRTGPTADGRPNRRAGSR